MYTQQHQNNSNCNPYSSELLGETGTGTGSEIKHICSAMYMIGYEDHGNPKGLTVQDMEKSLKNLVS